jgi:hypothetical protein
MKKVKELPNSTTFVPSPRMIFRAGQDQALFKYESVSTSRYLNKRDKLGADYRQEFLDGFAAKGSTFPIHIDYCSLSGRECNVISTVRVTCAPLSKKPTQNTESKD